MATTAPQKRYARKDWRKLLSSRKGLTLVGLVVAVLAGAVVIIAMAGYRKSVTAGNAPQTVYVAAQLIARNTPVIAITSENLYKPAQIRANQVATGALADMAAIHGMVAAKDIYPGEQLTTADFTGNGTMAAQLTPSERAVTLALDQAHGMVGVLQTGDHVDVYGGWELQVNGGQSNPVLRLLMSDVPVLKAGSNGNGSLGGSNTSSMTTVTLGVDVSQVGPVTWTQDNGKVWLVLRPAHGAKTTPPSMATVQSMLFGSKPVSNGGKS